MCTLALKGAQNGFKEHPADDGKISQGQFNGDRYADRDIASGPLPSTGPQDECRVVHRDRVRDGRRGVREF